MERGEGAGGGRGGRADLRGAAKENVWFDAESGGQGAENAQVARYGGLFPRPRP